MTLLVTTTLIFIQLSHSSFNSSKVIFTMSLLVLIFFSLVDSTPVHFLPNIYVIFSTCVLPIPLLPLNLFINPLLYDPLPHLIRNSHLPSYLSYSSQTFILEDSNFSIISPVIFHVSLPFNEIDWTLLLKICSFAFLFNAVTFKSYSVLLLFNLLSFPLPSLFFFGSLLHFQNI